MNTNEIEAILSEGLRGTNSKFLGVFASDCLPSHIHSYPSCLVANTDPHNLPGTHWVAFYFISPRQLEFFDSFGMHPSIYGFNLEAKVHYNEHQIQSFTSDVCGHYCIFFLYQRARSLDLVSICKDLLRRGSSADHYVEQFVTCLVNSRQVSLSSRCPAQCSQPQCKWKRK
jgi:hypothetical protein